MKRRIISMALAIIMCVGSFVLQASAATVASIDASTLAYNGLLGEAFEAQGSSPWGLINSKGFYVDGQINFGSMETILQERVNKNDNAGMRWIGWIVPPEDGAYSFRCYSDNGSRLWIGDDGAGTPLINYWDGGSWWDQSSTPTSWSSSINLEAGKAYSFRLDYFEAIGGSNIRLVWKNNSNITEQTIPASAFFLPDSDQWALIDSIDSSSAQLDLSQGSSGGTVKINGHNLKDSEVWLTTLAGDKLKTLSVSENGDEILAVNLPSDLDAGLYKFLLIKNKCQVPTTEYIAVLTDASSNERTEHPRADWKREKWMNLNGVWNFAFDPDEVGLNESWQNGHDYDLKINVPFGWSTVASGINNSDYRGVAWYEKTFSIDSSWTANGNQVYAYFGAVDNWARVFINGEEVQLDTKQYYLGEYINGHRGGYTPIEFNLTEHLNVGNNKLTVWVEDKGVYGQQNYPALIGKQGRPAPCGYIQTDGIWQTVMLESRGSTSLGFVHANSDIGDLSNGSVTFDVEINNTASDVAKDVTVDFLFTPKKYDVASDTDIVTGDSISGTVALSIPANTVQEFKGAVTISIPNQKLWSDVDPNLYWGTATLKIGGDAVDTVDLYFGQRQIKIAVYGQDSSNRDYSYVYLNNKPVYLAGLLDQGFWIEGLYTAPSEEALRFDVEAMKARGFNMIRKHLKVEDPLQYTWADKLGFFVWQDIPHANAMMIQQYTGNDRYAPGRDVYLDCLDNVIRRDYNHPSVIAIMLFNETWGIERGSGAATANTNPAKIKEAHTGTNAPTVGSNINNVDENHWLANLYYHTKELNPGILVEDMSACNNDHLNPTDLNTYHMYPKGYQNSRNDVTGRENATYPGSNNNFRNGYTQQGQPMLNSEYGGVGYGDYDYDISWCFKYQTDLQRQQIKQNGYVYTEPYDIENERNGLLTWERYSKVMGYEEIAWGGDMSIADLNQPNYVGIDGDPNTTLQPGAKYSRDVIAMNWSGNQYPDAVLKWRFDATDAFGNNIETEAQDLEGKAIAFVPYTQVKQKIEFNLPKGRTVGTL
ncbi:MAG: hypothetical protein LBC41_16650, partial [Clostridiales bacterium]|nr:hypothetical protein [Clostridiales bacterium]